MNSNGSNLRVLIVAEHTSAKWGGEAILPLHYFRNLRQRGIDAWLVVHERTREELDALLPNDRHRIRYIPDTDLQRRLYLFGEKYLPNTIASFTTQFAIRFINQVRARAIVRDMVKQHQIDIVHQPIPVSPKDPSLMYDVGAPVVIGPMNGGMSYPAAFAWMQSRPVRAFVKVGRWMADLVNRMIPGKLRAAMILVANDRTRAALPRGLQGAVHNVVENGVDLSLWSGPREPQPDQPVRLVFAGRLIDWKGVDLLLHAFAKIHSKSNVHLDIIGDGILRQDLQNLAHSLGLSDKVTFHGWMSQPQCAQTLRRSDVFVLPSLYECGGAVVLEAMACALPVIATDWGGPADYIDPSCGILISPASKELFIDGLAQAMLELANNPRRRQELGEAGRAKVEREYDWQRKVDRILQLYRHAISDNRPCQAMSPAVALS